jgi:uncharacterized protein (TIGR00730 family)
MKRITVFCGSSEGYDPIFKEAAYVMGKELASQNLALVYGGACIGLMGAVADAVMQNGGSVIGVIPQFLKTKEVAHNGLTELITVQSMHDRKTKMNELCDGVIAMPGGYGTFEELFEMLTWAQLGLHVKPVGLLNTNKFYDPLIALVQQASQNGFLKEIDMDRLLISDTPQGVLKKMKEYQAPTVDKWIRRSEV